MGRLRRSTLAATILAAPLGLPTPAEARACITVTVFVAGQPTPSGPHCQSVLDEFPESCPDPEVMHAGYGTRVILCIPQIV